ncbi:hypothetical protein [Nocardioides dongxiaopingii]|uniref:hypothetical protein n=1 Tax=Nocardioides dongxiaopingii TaxID=2576036 RepID=UPI0010C76DF4|nr:hypothetical protein [Nocardioides dongxiaopingii]
MTKSVDRYATVVVAVTAILLGLLSAPARGAAPTDDEYFDATVVVENSTFYPLVRDGFEDESVMVVGNSGYIDARATITDHLGRPVRTLQLTDYLTEDRDAVLRAAWDGRTEAGSLVEAGSYTVAFSADYTTVIDGEVVQPTVHAVREVRVATDRMPRRFERSVVGAKTSARSSGPGCRTQKLLGHLLLACRQGTRASASWKVRLPAGATRVRWGIDAERGHRGRGNVKATGKRLRHALVVTVVVTGSRRALVESIAVSYTRRTKI